MRCKSDPSFSQLLLIEKSQGEMKKHFFTYRKIITFYSRIEKQQIFKKINNFYQPLPLKVVFTTFLPVCFLSLDESTCQTRKNAFCLISKAFFVLEKIKF